jgi:hypothetical protein
LVESLPDGIDPCQVFGLHEDGTKTGNGTGGVSGKAIGRKETHREIRERKVKIEMSSLVEDALGEGGGRLRGWSGLRDAGGEEDNVELRWVNGRDKARILTDSAIQFKSGGSSGFEAKSECTGARVRQELLCCPESNGRGSGAGALEGDLAEVKVFRGKVGVGRVVFIEAADGGIAKENGSTAVGLEAVLVGIDDDGVSARDGVVGAAGLRCEVRR